MKNLKLFGKISIIDLSVIALVILLLVTAAVRMGFFATPDQAIESTKKVSYEKVKKEITFSVTNVSYRLQKEPFAVGDTLTVSKKSLGKIKHVERSPYVTTKTLQDGTVVTAEQTNAYTYTVKVKTTLVRKKGFLRTSKDDIIAIGRTLPIATKYFYGKATVIDIQ